MKIFNLIVFIVLPSLLFAQNEGVISIKENDFLYRGYDNYIDVGLNSYCDDSIWLECTNCETVEWKDHRQYIVRPLDERFSALSIMRFDGEKVFTVSSMEVYVRDLPDPKVRIASFWNDTPLRVSVIIVLANSNDPLYCGHIPSGKIRLPRLFAMYGPEVSLEAMFSVKKWCAHIHNETFQGEGSKINTDLLDYLMGLKFTKPVYMKVETTILGSDGKERLVTTLFELVP
jgi:hypothetical protein